MFRTLQKFILIFLLFPILLYGQNQEVEQEIDFSALKMHKARSFKQAMNYLKTLNEQNSPFRNYDVFYYRLKLKVYYEPDRIEGIVTIKGKPLYNDLSVIELDFHDNMKITAISSNIVSYEHREFSLKLTFDKPVSADSIFMFDIHYQGYPSSGGNAYFNFDTFPNGSRSVWTLSESYGARYWWPCKDSPQDKADSVDIIITVPSGQYAASNGTLIKTEVVDDSITYYWQERYPIATYLVSLAIGSYANYKEYYHYNDHDSMLLDYYVYPEYLTEAKSAFSEMQDFIDGLSHFLGPYPFLQEKYGHAQFGWIGGMEHQTLTSIGSVSSSVGWKYLYVHELGHQWFGDMVTCASWKDIWLNEGFTSYTEALYAEWAGFLGNPPGMESYHVYINTQRYMGDRTIIVSDTTDESNIFHIVVYDKGSWVLHMLRKMMGDDSFFKTLREYLNDKRWTYGSVTTENFKSVCETESGLSLTAFFDQWLNYPYYPKYEYFWDSEFSSSSGLNKTEVTIIQTQFAPLYVMPVDLTFHLNDGTDTTIVVQNNTFNQTYIFNFKKKLIEVEFDKDNWILKSAVQIPGSGYSDQIRILNLFPNPSFKNDITIEVLNWNLVKTELHIYNIQGQLIKSLRPLDKRLFSEYFLWDRKNLHGMPVASGTYFIRPVLNVSGRFKTGKAKKMFIIR
ncbi:MAG: hypothetical protein JXR46_05270 [Calditrichaceae bacterium]|nr:hypothetical protein [Calditrichaceae bacterium]